MKEEGANGTTQPFWEQGVPLPTTVLDWLKQHTQKALREPGPLITGFRQQYFKVPWCVVPHFVKAMVPRTIDAYQVEAQMLKHSFSNQMLLVEALTHPSYNKAVTPPNTRLAIIGAPVAELILVQALIQITGFAMH